MAAIDKTDPNRPFVLALRSTRLLAIVSTGLGLVMMIAGGFFNRFPQFRRPIILLSMIWLLPGVGFAVAAIMMKDRRRWAVIVAMITAGVQLPMAVAAFVANFLFPPMSVVPIVLSAVWVAALIQLMVHLRQALAVVSIYSSDRLHGFELIPSPPIAAIPISQPENQTSASDLPK